MLRGGGYSSSASSSASPSSSHDLLEVGRCQFPKVVHRLGEARLRGQRCLSLVELKSHPNPVIDLATDEGSDVAR